MFDNINPFTNGTKKREATAIIDEVEETLKGSLEKRIEVRRKLNQNLREARIQRDRAERQMSASSTDTDLAVDTIDAQDEVIEAYRTRIRALNEQITAIRKRLPNLEVMRSDVELLQDLETNGDWREQVDSLLEELNATDPVSGTSADAQLEVLLTSIDEMVADPSTTTGGHIPGIFLDQETEEETDLDGDTLSTATTGSTTDEEAD